MNTETPQNTQEAAEEFLDDMAAPVEDQDDISQNTLNVARTTMTGDLRDVVLQIMRDPKLTGKAWGDMTEAQQKDVSCMITDRVQYAISNAIQIITTDGRQSIIANLEQVVVKDGLKAVLTCSKHDELRHDLMDAQGQAVLIVITKADDYIGETNKVTFDKDQPDLPVEEPEQQEDHDDEPEQEYVDGDDDDDEISTIDRESAEHT